MQISPSLADFMEKLEEGPRGPDDALVIIQQCAQQSAPLLDLQQMQLTDEDLQLLAPKMASLSSHVTTLNLFMNQISVLPASLAALSGLQVLLAGCNPLERIDAQLFQGLPNLQELDIGFSETLQTLPDTFDQLTELRILLAGNGHLTALPSSLFQCEKLEELQVYGNALKTLSADIGHLKKLRVLNIGRNQIDAIPETIGECKSLETFHAYENCLTTLPKGATALSKLVTLNVMANEKLPDIPREVRVLASATATAKFFAVGGPN